MCAFYTATSRGRTHNGTRVCNRDLSLPSRLLVEWWVIYVADETAIPICSASEIFLI